MKSGFACVGRHAALRDYTHVLGVSTKKSLCFGNMGYLFYGGQDACSETFLPRSFSIAVFSVHNDSYLTLTQGSNVCGKGNTMTPDQLILGNHICRILGAIVIRTIEAVRSV